MEQIPLNIINEAILAIIVVATIIFLCVRQLSFSSHGTSFSFFSKTLKGAKVALAVNQDSIPKRSHIRQKEIM